MDTQGLRAYLISSRELTADWLVLYAVTFALQLLCASVRGALVYAALWVMLTLGKEPTSYAHLIAFLAAYGPLAFSLLTIVLPYGFGWPPSQLGGRYPSEQEQTRYQHALAHIRTLGPGIREPRRWYIRDQDSAEAIAYADTLLINTGLLEHEHAPLLLARSSPTSPQATRASQPPWSASPHHPKHPRRSCSKQSASWRPARSACGSSKAPGTPTGAPAGTTQTATPKPSNRRPKVNAPGR